MLHCLVFMVPHPLSRVQKLFYHSFFSLSTLFFIFFDVFFELTAFWVPPFQARVVVYHFLLPFVNSFFQKIGKSFHPFPRIFCRSSTASWSGRLIHSLVPASRSWPNVRYPHVTPIKSTPAFCAVSASSGESPR